MENILDLYQRHQSFSRKLQVSLQVDKAEFFPHLGLYRFFLTWNIDSSAKMAQAYDFALDHMGMDFYSYSIWTDYILFLKNVDVQGSYAENQKISQIRKIYHRGIVIPMLNVETLWYALFLVYSQKNWFTTPLLLPSLLGKSTLRSSRVSIPWLLKSSLLKRVEITWLLAELPKSTKQSLAVSIDPS